MKTNVRERKSMRVANIVVIVTMITLALIGGTFAKYIIGERMEEDARVAYWGIGMTGNTTNLFSNTYATYDTTSFTGANSVIGENGDLVVAPGTDGSKKIYLTYGSGGAPEVAYRLVATEIAVSSENWTDCPIKFSVGGEEYSEANSVTIADLSTEISNLFDPDESGALSEVFAPGTKLTADAEGKYPAFTIHWKWDFEGGIDAADTAHGNADPAPTINIEATINAEQVD